MDKVFTDEFLAWINDVDQRLIDKNDIGMHDENRILSRTVKLSEEVGELSEAILSYTDNQRREKLVVFDKLHLDAEIADVIITALVIARATKSDVNVAIINKLKKIQKRGGV